MKELENNAYFWQKVDTLYTFGDFNIIKKKGSAHETYPSLIYPVDYCLVTDLNDEVSLEAFKSNHGKKVDALVVCADIITKRFEVKALIGLDEEETEDVLRFLNCTDYQKTILVSRGKIIPSWAETE